MTAGPLGSPSLRARDGQAVRSDHGRRAALGLVINLGGCGAKSGEVWPGPVIRVIPVPAMMRQRSDAVSWLTRGESVSDRLVRFAGTSWQEIEALPQPLRRVDENRPASLMRSRRGAGLPTCSTQPTT